MGRVHSFLHNNLQLQEIILVWSEVYIVQRLAKRLLALKKSIIEQLFHCHFNGSSTSSHSHLEECFVSTCNANLVYKALQNKEVERG
jgi:hypothetical protein